MKEIEIFIANPGARWLRELGSEQLGFSTSTPTGIIEISNCLTSIIMLV